MLERLVSAGAELDAQDMDGLTAYAWAAGGEATNCVATLIAAGADPMAHHTSDDLLQLPTMEASELSTHDGSGATGPYVAVLGAVYDMSSSANFYGPGGKHRLARQRKCLVSLLQKFNNQAAV